MRVTFIKFEITILIDIYSILLYNNFMKIGVVYLRRGNVKKFI